MQNFSTALPKLVSMIAPLLFDLLINTEDVHILPIIVKLLYKTELKRFASNWTVEQKHIVMVKLRENMETDLNKKEKSALQKFMTFLRPPTVVVKEFLSPNSLPKLKEVTVKSKEEDGKSIVNNSRDALCSVIWSQSKYWLNLDFVIDNYELGEVETMVENNFISVEITCPDFIYKDTLELSHDIDEISVDSKKPRCVSCFCVVFRFNKSFFPKVRLSLRKKVGKKWPNLLKKGKIFWIKGDFQCIMDSDNEYWSEVETNPICMKIPDIWNLNDIAPKVISTQMDEDEGSDEDTSRSDLSDLDSVIFED